MYYNSNSKNIIDLLRSLLNDVNLFFDKKGLSIKSLELKKQNKVQAYKKVYNIIKEEIKKYIHSIQILIR